jgi:hypothetical protein
LKPQKVETVRETGEIMDAPATYTREYCKAVRVGCEATMEALRKDTDEVRQTVYEKGGLKDSVREKVSVSFVKWLLGLILLPCVVVAAALYGFYVSAPLTFASRDTVIDNQKQILSIQKDISSIQQKLEALPTTETLKTIVENALAADSRKRSRDLESH